MQENNFAKNTISTNGVNENKKPYSYSGVLNILMQFLTINFENWYE